MRFTMWEYKESNSKRSTRDSHKLCPHCEKMVLSGKYLFHLLIHSYEKPIQCRECHMRFLDDEQLDIHKKQYHVLSRYKNARKSAQQNPTVTINEDDSPVLIDLEEELFPCYLCRSKRKMYSQSELEVHTVKVHSNLNDSKNSSGNLDGNLENSVSSGDNGRLDASPQVLVNESVNEKFYQKSNDYEAEAEPCNIYSEENGVIKCSLCDDVFYHLSFFKLHWENEH